jgi:hypothetical protein
LNAVTETVTLISSGNGNGRFKEGKKEGGNTDRSLRGNPETLESVKNQGQLTR